MCRNGSGVVQSVLIYLVAYKQFDVHHLYDVTNILTIRVLKVPVSDTFMRCPMDICNEQIYAL